MSLRPRASPWVVRTAWQVAWAMLLGAAPSLAWHATGHLVTTQIAYDRLTDGARAEADRLVAVLAGFEPRRDHVVTASLWADDLKLQGLRSFDSWHYVNLPEPGSKGGSRPREDNVIWAIGEAAATLGGDGGDLAKALMLRFLVHLVADVHQPLHCIDRATPARPEGDRGGNDFAIDHRHRQLHAYWDHGGDSLPVFPGGEWRAFVAPLVRDVVRAVPAAAVPHWEIGDAAAWAEESRKLAVSAAYDGIEEGARPSAQYAARARETVRRRLAVGGYRLAAMLNELLSEER